MDTLECHLESFHQALHRGERPELTAFLPPGPPRHDILIELAHADLEYRLKHSEPVSAADYLTRYPELKEYPEAVAELEAAERKFRERARAVTLDGKTSIEFNLSPRPWPTIPGYEIQGELGRGGMSVVYRAWQFRLNRVVALKMLRSGEQAGPAELVRLLSEAETVAQLKHPNIVQIHEIGQFNGLPYLTLELCEGGTLADALRGEPLPVEESIPLMITLARTIHAAHQRGIIHRDLKPANVLLATDGSSPAEAASVPGNGDGTAPPPAVRGIPKISDFGLAKSLDGGKGLTLSGALLGTPSYMAPEQAQSKSRLISPATDVYSLGAIFYEMLTGRPPFKAATIADTVLQVLHEEAPSLHSVNRRIPRDLVIICEKCLSKDPAHRYSSALALAEDLERYQRREPIHARPASTPERILKWTSRHPYVAVQMAMASILALLVIAGLFWHGQVLKSAFEEANRDRNSLADMLRLEIERNREDAENQRYASDLRLAHEMLRAGDLPRLDDLLLRYLPQRSNGVDRRGFEWHYLERFRVHRFQQWRGHRSEPVLLAFTPDGRYLVTASYSQEPRCCRLWDLHQGDPLTPLWSIPLPADVITRRRVAALSPDGVVVALVGDAHTVVLVDRATGKERWRYSIEGARSLAFTPNSRQLAIGGVQAITFVDVATGRRHHTSPPLPEATGELAFSPEGTQLAVVAGTRVFLLDLVKEGAPIELVQGNVVHDIAWSRSGRWLAITAEEVLTLWDAAQGGIAVQDSLHRGPLYAVSFSPHEDAVVTGGSDGQVFWWSLDTLELLGHARWQTQDITSLTFTPDGKRLAAGASDGSLTLMEAQLTRQIQRLRPSLQATAPLAFSQDGKWIAVADRSRAVWLLDSQTGRPLLRLPRHLQGVAHLTFVPGSTPEQPPLLATIHRGDSRITLWDPTTGKLVRTWAAGSVRLCGLASAATGGRFATAGDQGRIRLWDVSTGIVRTLMHGKTEVHALAWSPDGERLLSVGYDRTLKLWDVSAGATSEQPLHQRTLGTQIRALAYAPNGRTVLTAEEGGTVRVWQAATLQPDAHPVLIEQGPVLQSLLFAPQGGRLLMVTQGNVVSCWDYAHRELQWEVADSLSRNWSSRWSAMQWSPDGKSVGVVRPDGTFEIWSIPYFKTLAPPAQPTGPIRSLVFDVSGKRLLTLSELRDTQVTFLQRLTVPVPGFHDMRQHVLLQRTATDCLRCWDVASGTQQPMFAGPRTLSGGTILARAPRQDVIAVGGEDGSIRFWDLATGKELQRLHGSQAAQTYSAMIERTLKHWTALKPIYPESVQGIAFSPSGRWFLSVSTKGLVRVWEVAGWRLMWELDLHQQGRERTCWAGFTATNEVLLVQGAQVRFLDPRDRSPTRAPLGDPNGIPFTGVAVSPDGCMVATANRDRIIQLWDLKNRQTRTMLGHREAITALAFARDGRTLASASEDRTVRLWSILAAQEVAILDGHRGVVWALAFSPDGTILASGGQTPDHTGEVLLWNCARPPQ